MRLIILLPILCISLLACQLYSNPNGNTVDQTPVNQEIVKTALTVQDSDPPVVNPHPPIIVGAERLDQYLHLLYGKRVAAVVNQTSTVGDQHLVDALIQQKVEMVKVFAPEHGFRGTADAGEHVANAKDRKTGLPIISLYGKNKKPNASQLQNVDVLVFDIQDVGARFYTYISTMHYIMEVGAELGIPVVVLDRPNPNGHYVDGPILQPAFQSFVGMHPIPIVHGMTVGELAQMINGERWLKGGVTCDLTVIPCLGYNHYSFYELPIKPSPNLPNIRSIYLYPSLCLMEPTQISVGRGTDQQFQVIGSPNSTNLPYKFKPVSKPGAKYPKHQNKLCYGYDLTLIEIPTLQRSRSINLHWLLDMYKHEKNKADFFTKKSFFNKLAGTDQLIQQIESGMTATQIRASWRADLEAFKTKRKAYLLYQDFE